jgi:hypothetical protein
MKLACGITVHSIPALPLTTEQRLRWEAWIKTLLKGEYRQGKGGLHNTKGEFCVMGVACDLIDNTRWIEDELDNNGDMRYTAISGTDNKFRFSECAFPPKDIQDLYALPGSSGLQVVATYFTGSQRIDDEHTCISQLNDMGATFEDLAEILKKAMTGGYLS